MNDHEKDHRQDRRRDHDDQDPCVPDPDLTVHGADQGLDDVKQQESERNENQPLAFDRDDEHEQKLRIREHHCKQNEQHVIDVRGIQIYHVQ